MDEKYKISEEEYICRCQALGIENEEIVYPGFSGFVPAKLDYIEFPGGKLEHNMYDKHGILDAEGDYHYNACRGCTLCCGPCPLCAKNSEVRVFGIRELLKWLSDRGLLCGTAETAANFIGLEV